jgi:hypothetical protein
MKTILIHQGKPSKAVWNAKYQLFEAPFSTWYKNKSDPPLP